MTATALHSPSAARLLVLCPGDRGVYVAATTPLPRGETQTERDLASVHPAGGTAAGLPAQALSSSKPPSESVRPTHC